MSAPKPLLLVSADNGLQALAANTLLSLASHPAVSVDGPSSLTASFLLAPTFSPASGFSFAPQVDGPVFCAADSPLAALVAPPVYPTPDTPGPIGTLSVLPIETFADIVEIVAGDVKSLKSLSLVNRCLRVVAHPVLFRDLVTCFTMTRPFSSFITFLQRAKSQWKDAPSSYVRRLTIRGSYGPAVREYADAGMHPAIIPPRLVFDMLVYLDNLVALKFEQCVLQGVTPMWQTIRAVKGPPLASLTLSAMQVSGGALAALFALKSLREFKAERTALPSQPVLRARCLRKLSLSRSHLLIPSPVGFHIPSQWMPIVTVISGAILPGRLRILEMACDLRDKVEVHETTLQRTVYNGHALSHPIDWSTPNLTSVTFCMSVDHEPSYVGGGRSQHVMLDFDTYVIWNYVLRALEKAPDGLTSITIRLRVHNFDVDRVLPGQTTLAILNWAQWATTLLRFLDLEHLVFELDGSGGRSFDLLDRTYRAKRGDTGDWMDRVEKLLRAHLYRLL
ncbi:hypothetical protein EUX98_g9177 [Antrodiella citrinella]|uniref:Uncharacterized protein n=1 Tax=Antrodiella citrinella TaxID=2447956 RepID=A0A4S4LXM7_9APHY|nr:hypothetical protein EUX98_g9177 [Antrodiella citrinella]